MGLKTILHTIDTLGPGGAETVFLELVTRLPKENYRPVVVIKDKGWLYEQLSIRGIVPNMLAASGSFDWRYLLKLIKLIRREKVDIIQSHLLGSNVYTCLAGLLTRTPVIATFHGAVDIGENERFKGVKFSLINSGAKYVVAVSSSLKNNIVNRVRINEASICVIHNGIDINEFIGSKNNNLREKLGLCETDLIVGSLGNIRPAKGYDVLMRAAAVLKDRNQNFKFVIAGQGSGALYEKLLKLRRDLDLEKTVHFLGFVDDAADFLKNLDIFLLSSSSEGFSISTIQAMACGLPVVVTRSGGPEEIVTHGVNGWIIEANDSNAIADGLAILASKPELVTKLGSKAAEKVEKAFNVDIMVSTYAGLYEQVKS